MSTDRKPPEKAKATKKEGVELLISSGEQIDALKVTAEYLYDLQTHNNYSNGMLNDMLGLIFNDEPELTVIDDQGKEAEDATEILTAMVNKVNLWRHAQRLYTDIFYYGSWICNPVWAWEDNIFKITELHSLPAASFSVAPTEGGGTVTRSLILQGIVLRDGKKEFWQTQLDKDGKTKNVQLNPANIFHVVNPNTPELAGLPIIMPVLPILHMLKFSWKRQMQLENRAAGGIVTLKINNPQGPSVKNGNLSDVDYGMAIVQNWGQDIAYVLRENMELIVLDIPVSGVVSETIDMLKKAIYDYFSPRGLVQMSEGQLIGGSQHAAVELVQQFVRSTHRWIVRALTDMLQPFLEGNGYEGHSIKIRIPLPLADQPDIAMQQAKTGFETQALTTNEIRKLLGQESLSDDELATLKEDYASRPAASTPGLMGSVIVPQQQAQRETDEEQMERELRARRDALLDKTLKALNDI